MYKFTHVQRYNRGRCRHQTGRRQRRRLLAGGTDLMTYMKGMCSPNPPTTLVNIKTITPSLDYIKVEGGTLKIGALATPDRDRRFQRRQERLDRTGAGRPGGRQPRAAQPRHHRRQHLPEAALHLLPQRAGCFQLPAQGPDGTLLRPHRRQHLPLHLRRRRRLHRGLPLGHRPGTGSPGRVHRHQQEDLGRG